MWNDVKAAGALLCWSLVWHCALVWSWTGNAGPDSPLTFFVELYFPVALAAFFVLRRFSRRTGRRYLGFPVMLVFAAAYFCLFSAFLGVFSEWGTWGAEMAAVLVSWSTGIVAAILYACMFFPHLRAKMKDFDSRHKDV